MTTPRQKTKDLALGAQKPTELESLSRPTLVLLQSYGTNPRLPEVRKQLLTPTTYDTIQRDPNARIVRVIKRAELVAEAQKRGWASEGVQGLIKALVARVDTDVKAIKLKPGAASAASAVEPAPPVGSGTTGGLSVESKTQTVSETPRTQAAASTAHKSAAPRALFVLECFPWSVAEADALMLYSDSEGSSLSLDGVLCLTDGPCPLPTSYPPSLPFDPSSSKPTPTPSPAPDPPKPSAPAPVMLDESDELPLRSGKPLPLRRGSASRRPSSSALPNLRLSARANALDARRRSSVGIAAKHTVIPSTQPPKDRDAPKRERPPPLGPLPPPYQPFDSPPNKALPPLTPDEIAYMDDPSPPPAPVAPPAPAPEKRKSLASKRSSGTSSPSTRPSLNPSQPPPSAPPSAPPPAPPAPLDLTSLLARRQCHLRGHSRAWEGLHIQHLPLTLPSSSATAAGATPPVTAAVVTEVEGPTLVGYVHGFASYLSGCREAFVSWVKAQKTTNVPTCSDPRMLLQAQKEGGNMMMMMHSMTPLLHGTVAHPPSAAGGVLGRVMEEGSNSTGSDSSHTSSSSPSSKGTPSSSSNKTQRHLPLDGPVRSVWACVPLLRNYVEASAKVAEGLVGPSSVLWAMLTAVAQEHGEGEREDDHYRREGGGEGRHNTTASTGVGGVVVVRYGDHAALRLCGGETGAFPLPLAPPGLPLKDQDQEGGEVGSPLLLSVERAMDRLRQAGGRGGAPVTANAGVTVAHGRMPAERASSLAEVGVDSTELLAFAPTLNDKTIHRTRQLRALEDLVASCVTGAVPCPLNFESRLVQERMAPHVLRQVLATAHRQGHTHPLFRYYAPTDELLLAVVCPTAMGRVGVVTWAPRQHMAHITPHVNDYLAQQQQQHGTHYKHAKSVPPFLSLPPCDLPPPLTSTCVYPSDPCALLLHHRPLPPSPPHILLHKDSHTLTLLPSTSPSPCPCPSLVTMALDHGARITITPGNTYPPSSKKKPDGLGTVDVYYTLPSGLVVKMGSEGSVVMHSLRGSSGQHAHPTPTHEKARVIKISGSVIRYLHDGSTMVLRQDGSSSLYMPSSPSSPSPLIIHTHPNGHRTLHPLPGSSLPPPPSSSTETPELLTSHEDSEVASDDATATVASLPSTSDDSMSTRERGRELSPLLCRTGTDPCTGATVTVLGTPGQEGHVVRVVYKGGEVWTRHGDGTSFRTKGQRLLVDGPTGYASVEWDLAVHEPATRHAAGEKVPLRVSGDLTRARVALPDGTTVKINYDTRVTASVNGKVTVLCPDKTTLTALDDLTITLTPRQLFPPSSSSEGGGGGEEGLYVVDLKEGVLRHVDSEHNTFTLPLHGPVTKELAGESEGVRARAVISNPTPPRLFVLQRDGSGTELLRHEDIAEWDAQLTRQADTHHVHTTTTQSLCDVDERPSNSPSPSAKDKDKDKEKEKETKKENETGAPLTITYHVTPRHCLPSLSHRGHNRALASHLFSTLCDGHKGKEGGWGDDALWALPPLAKTWAGVVAVPPPVRVHVTVVRTWTQLPRPTTQEARASVWGALERWDAFNKKRDTDVDRFKLHDPRDYAAREEEVALLKDLKKAYKAARLQRRKDREALRHKKAAALLQQYNNPNYNNAPQPDAPTGEGEGEEGGSAEEEEEEEEEEDPFESSSEEEDELCDVELEEELAAFEQHDTHQHGALPQATLRHALIQVLGRFVGEEEVGRRVAEQDFRDFEEDDDKLSFADFRRLVASMRAEALTNNKEQGLHCSRRLSAHLVGRHSLHHPPSSSSEGPYNTDKGPTGAYWDTDEARAAIANNDTLRASLLAPHGHRTGTLCHPSKEPIPSPAYPSPHPTAAPLSPSPAPHAYPSASLKSLRARASKEAKANKEESRCLSPSNHTNLTKVSSSVLESMVAQGGPHAHRAKATLQWERGERVEWGAGRPQTFDVLGSPRAVPLKQHNKHNMTPVSPSAAGSASSPSKPLPSTEALLHGRRLGALCVSPLHLHVGQRLALHRPTTLHVHLLNYGDLPVRVRVLVMPPPVVSPLGPPLVSLRLLDKHTTTLAPGMRCVMCVEVVAHVPGALSFPQALTIDTDMRERLCMPLLGTAIDMDPLVEEEEEEEGEEEEQGMQSEAEAGDVQAGGDNQMDG